MPNKILANDWLESGKKHLDVAVILFKNGHYTDIVGIELQHSIERVLKSVLAYNNLSIARTHDLTILLEAVKGEIEFDENIREQCEIATDYFRLRAQGEVQEETERLRDEVTKRQEV